MSAVKNRHLADGWFATPVCVSLSGGGGVGDTDADSSQYHFCFEKASWYTVRCNCRHLPISLWIFPKF